MLHHPLSLLFDESESNNKVSAFCTPAAQTQTRRTFALRSSSLGISSSSLSSVASPSDNDDKSAVSYDLVVIGGGSAGLTAAKFASTFGKSAVIIERIHLGGDCTWRGCVPSKTLLASAKVAHAVRTASKYGVSVPSFVVDMKAVHQRVKQTIQEIYNKDDSIEVMKRLGIDTIIGNAQFVSPSQLLVTEGNGKVTVLVHAKSGVLVATGATAARPTEEQIKGISSIKYFTYEEIFDLDKLPPKLTIVGGGPIGCELAQAFSRLGCSVTMVATKLIPTMEPEASQALENIFLKEGITIVKGRLTKVIADGAQNGGYISSSTGANDSESTSANDSESKPTNHIAICKDGQGKDLSITGNVLLVALGRKPDVHGLKLDEFGVKLNSKGGIQVNDKLCTNIQGIYAAGDCTGDKQL